MKKFKLVMLVLICVLLYGCAKWWDGGASGR
jgi:hypothetical protein